MPRAGLSKNAVVDLALTIVDADGPDGLTLAKVASAAGVATPSLYKHVRNLAELRVLVGVRIIEEMTGRFAAAVMGRGGDDAVATLMCEYRAYATDHPHRYAALPVQPLQDDRQATAAQKLIDVFLAVLRGYHLDGSDAIHATRVCRSMLHGFVTLEIAGGFGLPERLDETFDQLVDMMIADLNRPAGRSTVGPGPARRSA